MELDVNGQVVLDSNVEKAIITDHSVSSQMNKTKDIESSKYIQSLFHFIFIFRIFEPNSKQKRQSSKCSYRKDKLTICSNP